MLSHFATCINTHTQFDHLDNYKIYIKLAQIFLVLSKKNNPQKLSEA